MIMQRSIDGYVASKKATNVIAQAWNLIIIFFTTRPQKHVESLTLFFLSPWSVSFGYSPPLQAKDAKKRGSKKGIMHPQMDALKAQASMVKHSERLKWMHMIRKWATEREAEHPVQTSDQFTGSLWFRPPSATEQPFNLLQNCNIKPRRATRSSMFWFILTFQEHFGVEG